MATKADDFGFKTVKKKEKKLVQSPLAAPAAAPRVVPSILASVKPKPPDERERWARLKTSCAFYRLPKGCTNPTCRRDHVPLSISAEELARVPRRYFCHFPTTDCLNEQRDGLCTDGKLCPYRHAGEDLDADPTPARPRSSSTTPDLPSCRPRDARSGRDSAPSSSSGSPTEAKDEPRKGWPVLDWSREASPPATAPALPTAKAFAADETVEVDYGGEWFVGRIEAANADGSYEVYFAADHTRMSQVAPGLIRAKVSRGLAAFDCPLCHRVLCDPVSIADGNSVCRTCAEQWFARPGCELLSPCSHDALPHAQLTPNLALRRAIAEWVDRGLEA